jgi:hypothetical protein
MHLRLLSLCLASYGDPAPVQRFLFFRGHRTELWSPNGAEQLVKLTSRQLCTGHSEIKRLSLLNRHTASKAEEPLQLAARFGIVFCSLFLYKEIGHSRDAAPDHRVVCADETIDVLVASISATYRAVHQPVSVPPKSRLSKTFLLLALRKRTVSYLT